MASSMVAMNNKGKGVVDQSSPEAADDCCFVCYDGGELRICDYKLCVKAYHPWCVEKDGSFLRSDDQWTCDWHTCFRCHEASQFQCYTCKYAVCRRCLPDAGFLQVKEKKGFCDECLRLALFIEENKDCDIDRTKVDFSDQQTYEGLFKEYYMITKEQEGFVLRDIYAAKDRMKKKNHQFGSDSEEFDEEKEENDVKIRKRRRTTDKEKRSEGQKDAIKMAKMAGNTEEKAESNGPYASIEAKNIKLVYLRRKMVYRLFKNPESFEEKVTGGFIRVMSNTDYSSKKSYELLQVTGLKDVPADGNNTNIIFLVSTMPKEIHISRISNSDVISEEECEELRRKVQVGLLKRPTVDELQQKANILHRDKTMHWIRRGLSAMRKYAQRATGEDLAECLEEINKYESPSQQYRWLTNVPLVIADKTEPRTVSKDIENNIQNEESSPPSILPRKSTIRRDGSPEIRRSDEKSAHGHGPSSETKYENMSSEKPPHVTTEDNRNRGKNADVVLDEDEDDNDYPQDFPSIPFLALNHNKSEGEKWWCLGKRGERYLCPPWVYRAFARKNPYAGHFKVWKEDQTEADAVWMHEAIRKDFNL